MTNKLRNIIFFPTIGIIVLVVVFVAAFALLSVNYFANNFAEDNARTASEGIRSYIEEFELRSTAAAYFVANEPRFIQLVKHGSHSELLEFLEVPINALDMDLFLVVNHEERVLIRTHELDNYGDILPFSPASIIARDEGTPQSIYRSVETIPLAYSTTAPIFYEGEFLGVIITSLIISEPEFTMRMSQLFNAEISFYYGDRLVASSLPSFDPDREVFADAAIANAVLQDGSDFILHQTFYDTDYAVKYIPLRNSNGEIAGILAAAFSREALGVIEDNLLRGFIIIGIMGVSIALIVLFGVFSLVSKPILEANERVQLLFDASPMAMYLYDIRKKAIDCNKKVQVMFGYASKEAALEQSEKKLPPTQPDGSESQEVLDAIWEKAFTTGAASSELILQKIDGAPIPVEITYLRTKHHGNDVIAEYVHDLSKLKETEEKLRELRRFERQLYNANSIPSSIWNSKHEIIQVNNAMVKFLGVSSRQEALDRFMEFSPEVQPCGTRSADLITMAYEEIIKTGLFKTRWEHLNPETGESIPCEITMSRVDIKKDYFLVAYVHDLRDIIAAQEKERELQQLAFDKEQQAMLAMQETIAKSRFLAQISHEIRTPMNAVLGITEIQLQNKSLTNELKESLSHIRTSSYLLLSIINNLLDMSKAESGKMEIINNPYEIVSLIVDTAQLNMFYVGSKRIEFTIHVDENLPIGLNGDELRIKQILNNLLSNAFKYTNEGSVELSFEALRDESAPPNGITLLVSVKDTGRGMTSEQVRQLFSEEYIRFNEYDSIEGSGLGMMITYQLVKMMGGKIEVESERGKGTLTRVFIPQTSVGDTVIGKKNSQKIQNFEFANIAKHQIADFTRELMPYGRVLVVDDVELNLYVTKGHLAPYMIEVDTAISGFEAIERIKTGKSYDIVFMDHMMPEMDGVETVKKLRDDGYEGVIVALTANALVGNADIFFQNGFDGFISKPLDIRELNLTLSNYISARYPKKAEKYKNMVKDEEAADISKSSKLEVTPKMLEMFKRDAENAIPTLRKTATEIDLKLFTTTVHAMKTALAYIGENELSWDAAKLELAGKNGDMEYISSNFYQFIESLESLLDDIQILLPTGDVEPDTVPEEDMEHLTRKLKEVEAACLDYDVNSAVAIIEALMEKPWKKEVADKLVKLRNALFLESDFDLALEILKSF